ncbi:transposon protein, partial [Trifolium pratense]
MLESAEKFELAFEKLDELESSYRDYFGDAGPPISYDWDIGRAFATFLKLFYDATLVFSSSQEVSIHAAFHQIADIQCELQEACLDLNSVFASVGKEMVEKFNKYWGDVANMNKLLYFGVILDPRFKSRIIGWKFKEMYVGRAQFGTDLLASIEAAMTNLYNWYKQEYDRKLNKPSPMVIDPVVDTIVRAGRYSRKAKEKAFDEHLEEENAVIQKNELQVYLTSPCEKKSDTFDLLSWWKLNAATYPVLSIMARDILAIPVSTVASESAFSTGGRVIETFRSSLKPQMAEALICA